MRTVAARAPLPVAPRQDQDPHFNRATVGLYKPGSTFKLLTASMALDSGAANIWSSFDAFTRSATAASPSPTTRARTAPWSSPRCWPTPPTSARRTWRCCWAPAKHRRSWPAWAC
ncbi:penicillin-binding transpeptidase domain-containing protein [Dankookia sp. P2]|uniref:penicillin-binding transpeptidase domain-containing protein n=1 Tax=Dankookia sp. P2 TaxID=3423955 RepID=UPI003D67C95A